MDGSSLAPLHRRLRHLPAILSPWTKVLLLLLPCTNFHTPWELDPCFPLSHFLPIISSSSHYTCLEIQLISPSGPIETASLVIILKGTRKTFS